MSEAVRGVVVSHGDVARALVDAVQHITGERDALIPVSNSGCSRDTLQGIVVDAIATGPVVVFVDMPAGSCLQAVLAESRGRADVAVVAGVNLPMLLDFVYHRDLTPAAAAERAAAAGGRAIKAVSV